MHETSERENVAPTPAQAQSNTAPAERANKLSGFRAALALAREAAPALADYLSGKAKVVASSKPAKCPVRHQVLVDCPRCGGRARLATVPLRAKAVKPAHPVHRLEQRRRAITFSDLWPTSRERTSAVRAHAGLQAGRAFLIAAALCLSGCTSSSYYVSSVTAGARITDTSKDGSVTIHLSPRGGLAK